MEIRFDCPGNQRQNFQKKTSARPQKLELHTDIPSGGVHSFIFRLHVLQLETLEIGYDLQEEQDTWTIYGLFQNVIVRYHTRDQRIHFVQNIKRYRMLT